MHCGSLSRRAVKHNRNYNATLCYLRHTGSKHLHSGNRVDHHIIIMEQKEAENIKRKIVIGMDGSKNSEEAFKWYVEKFWQDGDYLIAVFTPEFKNLTHVSVIAADAALVQKIVDDEREHTKELLEKVTEMIKQSGIQGVARQSLGDPGEQLVEVATTEDACMIITGSRGLGTLRRTFLGSVSDYVVHHSHTPVLVYKPGYH